MKNFTLTLTTAVLVGVMLTQQATAQINSDMVRAIETDDVAMVKTWLDQNPKNVHATSYDEVSALHHAAMGGAVQVAELLIARGANVHVKDGLGYTPLGLTAGGFGQNNPIEMVRFLIAKGAKVNARSNSGATVLHQAARTDLHQAARTDGPEFVGFLIAKGANVNAKDKHGETPLDGALRLKQVPTANVLKKHGGRCNKHC